MKKPSSSQMSRRDLCRRLLGLATATPLAMTLLGTAPSAVGDWVNGPTIRVEEDWFIKIGTPEPAADSPQITTVMCPSWAISLGNYAVFDLNCATQPDFSAGGVQLQLWNGPSMLRSKSNANWDAIRFIDEEIRYTSVMRIEDGQIIFEIINGSSTTWGNFGTGELIIQNSTWRNHLNSYDPDCSTQNARIGWASYQVQSFVLERIRYYSNVGLEVTDNIPRVLHQYSPTA